MNKVELANEVLEALNLDTIESFSDKIISQYPYCMLEQLIDEAISIFSNKQVWDFTLDDTLLPYVEDTSVSNLSTLGIDHNKITDVFFVNPEGTTIYLSRTNRTTFKKLYCENNVKSTPNQYSLENRYLFLYPIPDQDYQIKVRSYKPIPPLIKDNDILAIPDLYTSVITNYIMFVMATLLEKNNAKMFESDYLSAMYKAKKNNRNYVGVAQTKPSVINWGY